MRSLLTSLIIIGIIGFTGLSFGTEKGKAAEHQQNIKSVEQFFSGEIVELENSFKLKTEYRSFTLKGSIPVEMAGKKVEIRGKLSKDRTTIYVSKIKLI